MESGFDGQQSHRAGHHWTPGLVAGVALATVVLTGCRGGQQTVRAQIEDAGGVVQWDDGQLVGIQLTGVADAKAALRGLPGLRTIRRLDVAETDFDDDALRQLPAQWPLRQLDLRATKITEVGLASLDRWQDTLAWLSLSETAVTQLESLTRLTQLEHVALPPRAGDQALATLAELPKLRILYAAETAVTGEGLAELTPTAFPSLKTLHLDGTRIDDHAVSQLPVHPQLERLTLADTAVGDRAADHLAQFQRLDYLDFSRTRLTDEGLLRLADLKLLYVIDVPGTRVTAQGLASLGELRPEIQVASDVRAARGAEAPPKETGDVSR